eukprot:COSAG01_NODE_12396_length_1748_cov_1.228623_1_plen_74_part_10
MLTELQTHQSTAAAATCQHGRLATQAVAYASLYDCSIWSRLLASSPALVAATATPPSSSNDSAHHGKCARAVGV